MKMHISWAPERAATGVAILACSIALIAHGSNARAATSGESLFGSGLVPLQGTDTSRFDKFGTSIALDRRLAIVGAPGNDGNSGAAYVFALDGQGNWTQQAKLVPPDGAFDSQLGTSVAIAGNTALVGTGVTTPEAAHVFVRHGSTWVREARLEVPEGQLAVALSAAGDRAVVGTSGAAQSPTEAVHVFARHGNGQWVQEAILSPDTGHGTPTGFGSSVAISGNIVVVGANAEDSIAGAAYVFARDPAGRWTRQARLTPADQGVVTIDAAFGWDVAVQGRTILIGAFGYNFYQGAAYIFQQQGGAWKQQARLATPVDAPFQCFGVSVALGFEAAIIGQPCHGQRGGLETHVYAYSKGLNGVWKQRAEVVSPAAGDTSDFGLSVATNGLSMVMGSPSEGTGGVAYAANCLPCLLYRSQQQTPTLAAAP
jgi:FG-GAP repeat